MSKTKDVTYNSAFYTVSVLYFIIQLAMSLLGFTILVNAYTFIVVSGIILLLLYAICVIIIMQIANNGTTAKSYENRKAFFIDKIQCDVERIKSKTAENDIILLLNKVSEDIRFSNLISPKEAAEIENKILDEISHLEKNINSCKTKDAKNTCEDILSLLKERNMICKLYKGE